MSIYTQPGVKLFGNDMTLHLVSLGPGVSSTNTGERGKRRNEDESETFFSNDQLVPGALIPLIWVCFASPASSGFRSERGDSLTQEAQIVQKFGTEGGSEMLLILVVIPVGSLARWLC